MDYNEKYIKYKTKYLLLKSENDYYIQTGGKKGRHCAIDDCNTKIKKRHEELIGMTNTNSFIPINKLSKSNFEYYIHDNGGRPFKVIANKQGISIYGVCINKEEDSPEYPKLIKHITNFLGYWSGFDSSSEEMHGNSLLIQLTKTKYIHIGMIIYSFETDSEILDFISPVGNNDVPYPIALDKDNVYFMMDHVFNKISNFEIFPCVLNAEAIYGEFYRRDNYNKKIPGNPQKSTKLKKFKIIRKREMDYSNC